VSFQSPLLVTTCRAECGAEGQATATDAATVPGRDLPPAPGTRGVGAAQPCRVARRVGGRPWLLGQRLGHRDVAGRLRRIPAYSGHHGAADAPTAGAGGGLAGGPAGRGTTGTGPPSGG